MPDEHKTQIARDITALAHGKAIYALTPVIEALDHRKRDRVYLFLASEYDGFADAVERLLTSAPAA